MSSSGSVPRIQVFRPTMEEFKNFSKYIEKIESGGAHKAGLAKIIPPEGWHPRKKGYSDIDLIIPAPISQVVTGRQGLYQQINIQQKAMTVKEFQKLAESTRYKTPPHFDYEDLERKYWKNITYNSPIYGADVSGSLYDDGVEEFNIQNLNTILDVVKEDYEMQIEGVNTAYLYFGMWKTTFAWHTEDMDLYSINYLHFGAPKSWYVVPPEHGRRLERLASGFFHGSFQSCGAFLRHKMTMISPQILKQYSIPYSKITQEPGEFMITFPFGYHSGFNHGFNCAESTNFALPRWVEYGKRSTSCTCRNDCVKICMDMFVRKYQPDRYELWKAGKDYGVHPEDPNRHYFAPPPKKLELAIIHQREERKKAKMTQFSQKIKRHPVSKLERKEKKQAELCAEQCDQPRGSDSEETEIYDVHEAVVNKSFCRQKKRRKKNTEARRLSSPSICEDSTEDNPVQKMFEVVKNEKDSEKTNKLSKNEEMQESPPTLERPPEIKSEALENPPDFKPFFNFEAKNAIKISNESLCTNTVSITLSKCDNQINIFEQYPKLKDAVTNGNIAVFTVDPPTSEAQTTNTSKSNCENFDDSIKTEKKLEAADTEFSNASFSKNWKCEQTHELKIRILKKSQKNSEESLNDNIQQTAKCDLKIENQNITNQNISNLCDIDVPKVKPLTEASSTLSATVDTKDKTSPDIPSISKVKRATNSLGNWSKPLQNLWQHQPFDSEAEHRFNEQFSRRDPHCAICIIFSPVQADTFASSPDDEHVEIPSQSIVKMPSFCYGNDLNDACLLDTNPLLLPDGSSPLLVCYKCKVCVHATCYGVTMLQMGAWVCDRCASCCTARAECCLCVLRGGALKPTNDNRWVHVVCAILIQETFFENLQFKQPVNVSDLTPNRQRLQCKYCFKSTITKEVKGACVQCQSGKCYLPFHVTCGYMAGVIFETSDWPEPIKMRCTRHISSARRKAKQQAKRHLTTIEIGERVIAKHNRNKRYYWATMKGKFIQDYYSILFEDNSHSTNTLPEDIISRDVIEEGPPEIDDRVQVKWTDEKIYNGIFKGSQSCELFVVEFDDGSVLNFERQQIYASDEEIPKEIFSKMSHSSESKNSCPSQSPTSNKRIRMSNAKYSPQH